MIKNVFYLFCLLVFINCKEDAKGDTPLPETETDTETDTDTDTDSETDNDTTPFTWQAVVAADDSQPIQRHEAAFVRVGQKFYLLGGRDIRAVSIFDTQDESWTTGPEPPLELHHFQPVVIEGKIYIIGALTGGWPNETPVTHVYIYDTATDSWSQGDEIPEARRRGSTGNVLYNGKVYIACGIKNGHIGDHKKWMDLYDPATGTWEVLADAPRARDHFQAVLVNGKIVAPAGRNTGIFPDQPFGGTIAEVDSYDISSNTWETLPNNLPTVRAGNAATLFQDKVLVIGGESTAQQKAHAEVEALNLTTNEWESLDPLLEGRHGTGLVEYEGALYIASGCGNRGGSPELFTMEKYAQ
ncbi:Kelch repeat-containing protein [Maribacter sp. 2307UL18-2]|uniref:Kelch repeat-containing protein n=1 Tax=Maribacter sp. 2307UL18-2 TaxID=3386274 RepID=UPI0039BC8A0D